MKYQIFTILTLMLLFKFGFSQNPAIELDITNKKIDYFIKLEQKLGSEKFNTQQTYLGGDQLAQPEIFRRKEKDLPDLLVHYTFFKNDSTISEILYEWDVYNFETKDDNKQSLDFEKKLIQKYVQLVDFISSKFGTSEFVGNLDDLSMINSNQGLKRKDTWKAKNKLKIYSYTTISNFYRKEGFVTINPTHRIRVYVKKEKEDPDLKLNTTR